MIDYKKSGVDIQAGDDLVSWLQTPPDSVSSASTSITEHSDIPDFRKRVLSGIGGFAALFDGRFPQMKDPVLVSCTDGVGTKVKLAAHFGDFSGVGQDLVAMCANDLICTGGTPLFFLDYYAVGRLDLPQAREFLAGVRRACDQSHMALIGGETAEMPGVYQPGDFDCAGFSVGVVDRSALYGPERVRAGDAVLGLESSGFHSNGFSLLRRVFEGDYETYRQWLLEPTRLYVAAALMLRSRFQVHAMAHITGGGIDNLPRVLPPEFKACLGRWEMPECFREVQKRAGLSDDEMRTTFNCGMGLMVILPESEAENARRELSTLGYESRLLGHIRPKGKEDSDVEWV